MDGLALTAGHLPYAQALGSRALPDSRVFWSFSVTEFTKGDLILGLRHTIGNEELGRAPQSWGFLLNPNRSAVWVNGKLIGRGVQERLF